MLRDSAKESGASPSNYNRLSMHDLL